MPFYCVKPLETFIPEKMKKNSNRKFYSNLKLKGKSCIICVKTKYLWHFDSTQNGRPIELDMLNEKFQFKF